jgi:hypothetical protein
MMKRTVLVAFALLPLASGSAMAATTAGNSALALAALVAFHSPLVSAHDKNIMARMFNGNLSFSFPKNRKILVRADAVVCRASDVDITLHSCTLTFGKKTAALKGRKAHELFATVAEAGVSPEGAAGSIFESLSQLVCTIDPNEIKQRAGGGADCTFKPGGP